MLAVRLTQAIQLAAQKRVISRLLKLRQKPKLPLLFKLFNWFPVLRRIPARLIGVGVRPEHVHTAEALPAPRKGLRGPGERSETG